MKIYIARHGKTDWNVSGLIQGKTDIPLNKIGEKQAEIAKEKIEDKIAKTEGYEDVNVNFSTLKLSFKTDKKDGVKEEIVKIVTSLEPEVEVLDEGKKKI